MVHTSKIAIALAIIIGLATASAASKSTSAASKSIVHSHVVPRAAYNSFGYAGSSGQIHEPINMHIQDQDLREGVGLPYGG